MAAITKDYQGSRCYYWVVAGITLLLSEVARIASDQPSRGLAAARAHVIVEVHVTAHGIPHRPDVPLDGSVLLVVYNWQCAFINLDIVRCHYPLSQFVVEWPQSRAYC